MKKLREYYTHAASYEKSKICKQILIDNKEIIGTHFGNCHGWNTVWFDNESKSWMLNDVGVKDSKLKYVPLHEFIEIAKNNNKEITDVNRNFKFKIGDKVKYYNTDTIVVGHAQDNDKIIYNDKTVFNIVEHLPGWPKKDLTLTLLDGQLDDNKRYHYASDSTLELDNILKLSASNVKEKNLVQSSRYIKNGVGTIFDITIDSPPIGYMTWDEHLKLYSHHYVPATITEYSEKILAQAKKEFPIGTMFNNSKIYSNTSNRIVKGNHIIQQERGKDEFEIMVDTDLNNKFTVYKNGVWATTLPTLTKKVDDQKTDTSSAPILYEIGDKIMFQGEVCPIVALVKREGYPQPFYVISYTHGWKGPIESNYTHVLKKGEIDISKSHLFISNDKQYELVEKASKPMCQFKVGDFVRYLGCDVRIAAIIEDTYPKKSYITYVVEYPHGWLGINANLVTTEKIIDGCIIDNMKYNFVTNEKSLTKVNVFSSPGPGLTTVDVSTLDGNAMKRELEQKALARGFYAGNKFRISNGDIYTVDYGNYIIQIEGEEGCKITGILTPVKESSFPICIYVNGEWVTRIYEDSYKNTDGNEISSPSVELKLKEKSDLLDGYVKPITPVSIELRKKKSHIYF